MEPTERVHAQVVLMTPSGKSASQTTTTANQVDSLRPDQKTIAEATASLEQAGFRIEQSGITLSVSGLKQRFETVFGVHLTKYRKEGQTYYRPDKTVTIPESMRTVVETIVWAEPRHYFS